MAQWTKVHVTSLASREEASEGQGSNLRYEVGEGPFEERGVFLAEG